MKNYYYYEKGLSLEITHKDKGQEKPFKASQANFIFKLLAGNTF